MSPHSLEVAGRVPAHAQRPLLPAPSRLPGARLLACEPRYWQLSGKEMTLEPGMLWEKQLRGPAGLLLPCPAP